MVRQSILHFNRVLISKWLGGSYQASRSISKINQAYEMISLNQKFNYSEQIIDLLKKKVL